MSSIASYLEITDVGYHPKDVFVVAVVLYASYVPFPEQDEEETGKKWLNRAIPNAA